MQITLNKRLIENIIRESLGRILKEAQGLKSQKLYDIFQQYGGKLGHCVSSDLHNLTDGDIIGVLTYTELRQILTGHNQDQANISPIMDLIYGQKKTDITLIKAIQFHISN